MFFIGLYSLMFYLEFWHPYLKMRLLKLSFYILCDLDISVRLTPFKKIGSFLSFSVLRSKDFRTSLRKSGLGTYLWQFSHISLIFILKKYLIKSFISPEVSCSKLYFCHNLLFFKYVAYKYINNFSSVQLLSQIQLFVTPWIAACQANLSITSSWSVLKLMSIESVMPSNHLILCHSHLLLPWVFPSIRLFSNRSEEHSLNSSHAT